MSDQAAEPGTETAPSYLVVVNAEEQYSIWPAARPVPAGWQPVGDAGAKAECLDRVAALWTDMRPLSLR